MNHNEKKTKLINSPLDRQTSFDSKKSRGISEQTKKTLTNGKAQDGYGLPLARPRTAQETKQKDLRETSQKNTKNIQIAPDDLWGIGGHWPEVQDLKTILVKASTSGGKGFDPIRREYAIVKINGSPLPKKEYLARVLGNKYSRVLLFELLKEKYSNDHEIRKSSIPCVKPADSLEDYYVQCFDYGPKFNADDEDCDEIKKMAGIYLSPGNSSSRQDLGKKLDMIVKKHPNDERHLKYLGYILDYLNEVTSLKGFYIGLPE